MKLDIIRCHVSKNDLHVMMYSDFKGNIIDLVPLEYKRNKPLFRVGELIKVEGIIQEIQSIEVIPAIADKSIESSFEGQLSYSNSGWFGYKYFIGARVI